VQFRSLHSLARRTLAAGATSALALTLFNAVQPSLDTPHRIGPGTIKDVPVTLLPTTATRPRAPRPRAPRLGPLRPGLWTTPRPLPLSRLRSPSGGLKRGPRR
jgi:hypothetical protein